MLNDNKLGTQCIISNAKSVFHTSIHIENTEKYTYIINAPYKQHISRDLVRLAVHRPWQNTRFSRISKHK
jgi:hypothetical protein